MAEERPRGWTLRVPNNHVFAVYSPMKVLGDRFKSKRKRTQINASFSPAPSGASKNKYRTTKGSKMSIIRKKRKSLNKTIINVYQKATSKKNQKKFGQVLPILENVNLINIPEKTRRRSKRVQQFRYHQNVSKKNSIKKLARRYKDCRQNSLLTIATGTSSRYHNTTRQTDAKDMNMEKLSSLKLPMIRLNDQAQMSSHRPK